MTRWTHCGKYWASTAARRRALRPLDRCPAYFAYIAQFPIAVPTSKYRENIGRACKNGDGRELGDCGDYENIGASWARPRIADIRTRRA
ncbi:hypothetical protein MABM_05510 [Mycobacteroides abscessus]|nr:hypothetical protein MABM_05510 [Mycobacteroides abscessus]